MTPPKAQLEGGRASRVANWFTVFQNISRLSSRHRRDPGERGTKARAFYGRRTAARNQHGWKQSYTFYVIDLLC
jgi:hypothetical protein